MNLLKEIKNEFSESSPKSATIYSLCMKLEEAERKFMDSLSDEQKELFNNFMNLEMDRSAMEVDEAIEFGFNCAKNMFQALIGIKN